jgi:Predicted protein tyrosine phosphatase
MNNKPKILVVCGKNKRRSRTAEYIFKNDSRFLLRTAGLSPKSEIQISERSISWANLILVMEKGHKNKISNLYRNIELPRIEVLDIEDNYEYLEEELIELLKERINQTLEIIYQI